MPHNKSKKVIETEIWVDEFIKTNYLPPTYEEVGKRFGISSNTAWYRCGKFRVKMRQNKTPNLKDIGIVQLRIEFEKRFISSRMTAEQLQGAESVWQWVAEMHQQI